MPARIDVRVQPRTSRGDVQREVDGSLRVWETSATEAGKANEDVLRPSPRRWACQTQRAHRLSGHRARSKVVEVDLTP